MALAEAEAAGEPVVGTVGEADTVALGVEEVEPPVGDGEDAADDPDGLPQEAARSAIKRMPTTLMLIKRIASG
jgi:hypothetical protein